MGPNFNFSYTFDFTRFKNIFLISDRKKIYLFNCNIVSKAKKKSRLTTFYSSMIFCPIVQFTKIFFFNFIFTNFDWTSVFIMSLKNKIHKFKSTFFLHQSWFLFKLFRKCEKLTFSNINNFLFQIMYLMFFLMISGWNGCKPYLQSP